MQNRELGGVLPPLEEIENEIVHQTRIKAAAAYQEQEQIYWNNVHNILDLPDDPDYACDSLLMEGELFTSRVKMSFSLRRMQEIVRDNNFVIGGLDGKLTVGESVAYDCRSVAYEAEEWITPPQPGVWLALEKSQVSVIENGQEVVILQAQV